MSNGRELNFNPSMDKDRGSLRGDLASQYQTLQGRVNASYEYMSKVEAILGPRFVEEIALKPGELGYMTMYKAMSCYRMYVNAVAMMEHAQMEIMEKLVGPDFEIIPEDKTKDTDEKRRIRRVAEKCLSDLAQKYSSPVPPAPPS